MPHPKPRAFLAFLSVVLFLCVGSASAQYKAKDYFKAGEQLSKQGQILEAADQYKKAVELEPKSKKYQERWRVARAKASVVCKKNAEQLLDRSPHLAKAWLGRALDYDNSNLSAVATLESLQRSTRNAQEIAIQAQVELDSGNPELASARLQPVLPFRELVPRIAGLEKELDGAWRILRVETLWRESRDAEATIARITTLEKQFPTSVFLARSSGNIRREVSAEFLRHASVFAGNTPRSLLLKLSHAQRAAEIDRNNKAAAAMIEVARTDLVRAFSESDGFLPALASQRFMARLRLAALKLVEESGGTDSRLASESRKFEAEAFPALRIRLLIPDEPLNCAGRITKQSITDTIVTALGRVCSIDAREWDLTLRVTGTTCIATDIPRQNGRKINSTYVAGKNQLTNPEYVRLTTAVQAAEIEYSRAQLQYSINPNFWTAYALGSAAGTLQRLRTALAGTAPYFYQNITLQYQYDEFEALRSFGIESRIQIYSSSAAKGITAEKAAHWSSEDRKSGIEGVLETDMSGAKNSIPTLLSMEELGRKVSSIPLEVERRFSDPIRLESGCESSEKGENRREETLSHDRQERHSGLGAVPEPEWAGAAADGGVDRGL